jgi:hypothetical protein
LSSCGGTGGYTLSGSAKPIVTCAIKCDKGRRWHVVMAVFRRHVVMSMDRCRTGYTPDNPLFVLLYRVDNIDRNPR